MFSISILIALEWMKSQQSATGDGKGLVTAPSLQLFLVSYKSVCVLAGRRLIFMVSCGYLCNKDWKNILRYIEFLILLK